MKGYLLELIQFVGKELPGYDKTKPSIKGHKPKNLNTTGEVNGEDLIRITWDC